MLNYIIEFFEVYDYPQDSRETLIATYNSIISDTESKKVFDNYFYKYSENVNIDFDSMLEECEAIAAKLKLHEYSVKLLIYICLSKALKEHYVKAGYSIELYNRTILDLKYKLIECKLIKSVDGTFVARWISGFFKMTRFGFKRLQFEIGKSKVDYTVGEKSIKVGDPVIVVHIPRTETPLTPAEFEEDFETVKEFFKDTFKGTPTVFTCHSWLLYEKLRDFLRESSNIIAFMNKFDIVYNDYLDDGDYSQLWRLYDVAYSGNLDDLPEKTSLHRAYKKYLKNGGKWGAGYGLFFA